MHSHGFCELLTAAGPAAIAVIRVGGPGLTEFLRAHVRRREAAGGGEPTIVPGAVWRGELVEQDETSLDDVIVSLHGNHEAHAPAQADASEARLHLHGSRYVVARCLELLESLGFKRTSAASRPPNWRGGDIGAHGNQRQLRTKSAAGQRGHAACAPSIWRARNQIEVEAYDLLPQMLTLAGAEWMLRQAVEVPAAVQRMVRALDDAARKGGSAAAGKAQAVVEQIRRECTEIAGRDYVVGWFAQPLRVAVVGPPNAGKSTLVNALADRPASIVSHVPGTTRDWVEVQSEMRGLPVTWLDTAGLRATADDLERAGIEQTRRVIAAADLLLFVLDVSTTTPAEMERFICDYLPPAKPYCCALNKVDLAARHPRARAAGEPAACTAHVSAVAGTGVEELWDLVLHASGRNAGRQSVISPFSDRQVVAFLSASNAFNQQELRDRLIEISG